MSGRIGMVFSLAKGRLSLMNACTAFLGWSAGMHVRGGAFGGTDIGRGCLVFLAVFFLSGGAAALNHYQDRFIDERMKRTRLRPIPMKQVTPKSVLVWSAVQIVFSLILLGTASGSGPAVAVALAAVFLYNGLYTPLKKSTLWAFLPGLISGSLPPVIGWLASGAAASLPVFFYMSAALTVWQIPHYWLLTLSESTDPADRILPSFYALFTRRKLANLTWTWMVSFSLIILLLPMFLAQDADSRLSLAALTGIVVLFAAAFIALSFYFLKAKTGQIGRRSFLWFNGLSLLLTLLLSVYFIA
jgi:protoheme IX farnesyltransferase